MGGLLYTLPIDLHQPASDNSSASTDEVCHGYLDGSFGTRVSSRSGRNDQSQTNSSILFIESTEGVTIFVGLRRIGTSSSRRYSTAGSNEPRYNGSAP